MAVINTILLTLICLVFGHPIFAFANSPLSTNVFFSKHEAEKVVKGTIITDARLKYHKTISTEAPNFITTNLPITKYTKDIDYSEYEMIAVEKAFMPFRLNKKTLLELYNRISSYSKLSDIEYYSRSEGRELPFILYSSRINSPTNKRPIKDAVYDKILPKRTNYFQIKDNRFGVLTFKSDVYNEGYNFIIKNTSLDRIKKYTFKINNKGEYHLVYFLIYDPGLNGYFYYAFHAMRIRNDSVLKSGLFNPENFANRIRASTVHIAKYFRLDWSNQIKPFWHDKTR